MIRSSMINNSFKSKKRGGGGKEGELNCSTGSFPKISLFYKNYLLKTGNPASVSQTFLGDLGHFEHMNVLYA